MALCEAAAYYYMQGKTLCDRMNELFEAYGYYRETLCTITLKGMDGAAIIQQILERVRNNPPKMIGSWKVKEFRDYEKQTAKDLETGAQHSTRLPVSNVLYFDMEEAWCCIRPSGTEPKVKYYIGVKGADQQDAEEKLEQLTAAVSAMVQGD